MEEYAKNVLKWLQNKVSEAEAKDTKLRPMKDRINEISKQIESAPEGDVPGLIKLQTEAIRALVDHITN